MAFSLDYETRSELDLTEVGLDNYSKSSTTSVILCAYAHDDQKVKLWEPHKSQMPAELEDALLDPFVRKSAFNSAFERIISQEVLKITTHPSEWECSMIKARYVSVAGDLELVGRVLGLKEDQKKLEVGRRLIKKFCEPAIKGGQNTLFGISKASYRDWATDPDDWKLFGQYCMRDVEAERAVAKKLVRFPVPDFCWEEYALDQIINDRGLPTDLALGRGAEYLVKRTLDELIAKLKKLTGLENPNSGAQMLGWLHTQGYPFGSLGKAFVARAIGGEADLTDAAKEALEIRGQTSKTSVKKYLTIALNVNEDGRLRHQFSFMGAARTGRWSAKGVQLQNLPRPSKKVEKKLELALDLVRKKDYDGIVKEFTNPLDVVTSTLRSSFRAPDGFKMVIADLASIESLVIAYAARCITMIDAFVAGRDPYLSFAAALYGIPYEVLYAEYKAGDKSKRNYCKAPTLGAGFRLSGGDIIQDANGDFIKTGLLGYAAAMGTEMTKEDADRAVQVFRATYPEVKQLWYDLEDAAVSAIHQPGKDFAVGPVTFNCLGKTALRLILPSGRALHYIRPSAQQVEMPGKQGKPFKKWEITHEGKDKKTGAWGIRQAHGGVFCENLVQAIARDLLCSGMKEAERRGFPIILHVHDELGALLPVSSPLTHHDLEDCMKVKPAWFDTPMPLGAEGFTDFVYRKG